MIRAEIKKAGQLFALEFPTAAKEELSTIYEHALQVATGKELHPTVNGILDLGPSDTYEYIKVDYIEGFPVLQPVKKAPEGFPTWEELKTDILFLGNKYPLEIQEHITKDGDAYYIPMFIDGQPALDMLGATQLDDVTRTALGQLGISTEQSTIIIPHASLPDWDEARDYIKDYVKDVEKLPGRKSSNAKAWTGYHLDDKGVTE